MNFTIEYLNIKHDENNLYFQLKGNKQYGLDKTIINAIRRISLTRIPTVSLSKESVNMINNVSSLNNEYIIDRISLLHLNINPDNYNNQYLFKLKVKNDSQPLMRIKSDSFDIYKMKPDILDKIKQMNEMSYVPESMKIIESVNNYEITPIPDSEKKEILNPFIYKSIDYYPIITELKYNTSTNNYQELELYSIPSVNIGKVHAMYNNISCSTYSFTVDQEMATKIYEDSLKIKKIKDEHIEEYKKTFETSELDRYYHRDNNNEPYWYNYTLESEHFKSPKEIWLESIKITINDFEQLTNQLKLLVDNDDKSKISINIDKNIYSFKFDVDESLVSIIQSHLVNKYIDSGTFIDFCGYKKIHPLKMDILLKIIIKSNKSSNKENLYSIIKLINEAIYEIISILNIMHDSAIQLL